MFCFIYLCIDYRQHLFYCCIGGKHPSQMCLFNLLSFLHNVGNNDLKLAKDMLVNVQYL